MNDRCSAWNCFEIATYVIHHKYDKDISLFIDVCKKHYEIINKKEQEKYKKLDEELDKKNN